jgi:hypothetical protein
MSKDNLIQFIESNPGWFSVLQEPESLETDILRHVSMKIVQRLNRFRILQRVAVGFCMLSIVLGVALGYHATKPTQYVIHYPASGKEKSVVVEGNFRNPAVKERVKMKLDQKSNLWKVCVTSRKTNLVDYTIYVVENTDDEEPSDPQD